MHMYITHRICLTSKHLSACDARGELQVQFSEHVKRFLCVLSFKYTVVLWKAEILKYVLLPKLTCSLVT